MNTLQFYLDETAKKMGYFSFDDACKISSPIHMKMYVEKAATLYAEEACKEQLQGFIKHIDETNTNHWERNKDNPDKKAKLASAYYVSALTHVVVYLKSRLNAPLAVNTEK